MTAHDCAFTTVSVFVLAGNSMGEPLLLAYDVHVTQAEYEDGVHYDIAENRARNSGYSVIGRFDEHDIAGQQLIGKRPLYGDADDAVDDYDYDFTTVSVFLLAENSEGTPELLAYDVHVTKAEYESGVHYDIAEDRAENSGYNVIGRFDEHDIAGQQLMEIRSLHGDTIDALSNAELEPAVSCSVKT